MGCIECKCDDPVTPTETTNITVIKPEPPPEIPLSKIPQPNIPPPELILTLIKDEIIIREPDPPEPKPEPTLDSKPNTLYQTIYNILYYFSSD